MSKCRPAKEVNLFKQGWIPTQLVDIFADLSVEEFVLLVRNGAAHEYVDSSELSVEKKLELKELLDDVYGYLTMKGFIRPETIKSDSLPETYFVSNYIYGMQLSNELEQFMPYFFSNEAYERYDFCYERMESTINMLANFLDEDELLAVALDIMSMNEYACNDAMLQSAKEKIKQEKETIVPLLALAFAMY